MLKKKYLFVAETHEQALELYALFYGWLKTIDAISTYSASSLNYVVSFTKPKVNSGFIRKIFRLFKKPWKSPIVRIDFICIQQINESTMRGRHYNEIIIDLTTETRNKYIKKINYILRVKLSDNKNKNSSSINYSSC